MVEAPAILSAIPLALILSSIGLLVNLLQALCYLIIWPVSKNVYRRLNGILVEIFWLAASGAMEWWSGFEIKLYADLKTFQLMGKENAILMSNHISDLDTVIALILAQRSGCLGSALTIVKKTTILLPIYGWACWFSEFVFLDRDWNKDKITLEAKLEGLKDFYRPFWLTIFAEGTRNTPDKLLEAQNYAASKGLHVPKNVLIPRTKGFVAAVQQLRARVPAIYDVTIAVPKSHPRPSMLRVIQMKPSLVHIHVKRYPITEIPKSDEGIAQWCKDTFVAKDHLIDKFQTQGTFGDPEIGIPGRSRMSLLVFVSISFMISALGVTIYQRFPFLSTQKGIGLVGVMLVSAGVLSHTFIEFTKLPPMPNKLSSIE